MNSPTVEEIRTWSNLDFNRRGYADDAKLQVALDRAVGYVLNVTGQTIDGMPTGYTALAQEAIQKRVEQVVIQSGADYIESAGENDVIQSFSAGLYSESRRDPNAKRVRINTWPALDELLWQLMTPEKYDFWIALLTGEGVADFSVVEVAWGPGVFGLTWFEPWDRLVVGSEGM